MKKFFNFKELNTNIKTEVLAGLTTFATMSYILIVNPKMLASAGFPFEASITATILAAFFGCMLMGLYAKRPFAVAPYVGEVAFIAYTVVIALGESWRTALGAIFVSGFIFFILTAAKIRPWLVNSMSETMKKAFSVGLGLFLIFVGTLETGIIKFTQNSIPIQVGDFHEPTILLAIFGFVLTITLMQRNIKAAILIGIVVNTLIGYLIGDVYIPEKILSAPPSIMPLLGQLDFSGLLNIKFLPTFFTIFLLVYVDTMGCMMGVCYKAGLLDDEGCIPEIKKPMFCDSLSTMFASFMGTITSGIYLESVTGIQSGGKSGLTAVITGLMFLLGLFLTPLFTIIPPYAYGPAILIVGMLMVSIVGQMDFEDVTEYMPALFAIAIMVFSYNIGIGMAAGFVIYPIFKLLTGKKAETNLAMWILALFSLAFFIVYPY